ncbi:hypothetical protein QTH25_13160 [Clostridium perfringens]|uniref:hypothetical protein n=1 Tax=Clostridium perfringens TaxID=1502 RepID=UPI00339003F0|nr:hypothetical protein [Clostridium perfringens]
MVMRKIKENREFTVDWSKFKSSAKGDNLIRAKDGYIEFCKMLDEVDFELMSDYINNKEKVELVYRLNNDIKLNKRPDCFKTQTYKTIIDFKNKLIKNKDRLIKFIGLTNDGKLTTRIKTFDGGEIDIDIRNYDSWNRGRIDFYNKLKEVNGYTEDFYKGKEVYINFSIEHIKLNPMSPHNFKAATYKNIINFKNNLKENNDAFIKFVGLTNGSKLIAKIKTFDDGIIEIDMGRYSSFIDARQDTYYYCKEKGYKILSSYISGKEKILVDFNCGHDPHWTSPSRLKQNQGCPVCNASKGEKEIREYLKKNNIEFKREYRFEDCKYKQLLPFDFYISNYNLCIEFDGRQHFESFEFYGGEQEFKLTQIRDEIKNNYCKDNGVKLIRIPYWELDNIERILDEEFDRLRKLNDGLKEIC